MALSFDGGTCFDNFATKRHKDTFVQTTNTHDKPAHPALRDSKLSLRCRYAQSTVMYRAWLCLQTPGRVALLYAECMKCKMDACLFSSPGARDSPEEPIISEALGGAM